MNHIPFDEFPLTLRWVCAIVLSLTLAGCAALQPPASLPIADIVQWSRDGVPAEDIIQRVRRAKTSYALRGSDFSKLRAAGVSDAVLDQLQFDLVNDIDLLTRYAVLGESLGGCAWCYPQPVDLDGIAQQRDASARQ